MPLYIYVKKNYRFVFLGKYGLPHEFYLGDNVTVIKLWRGISNKKYFCYYFGIFLTFPACLIIYLRVQMKKST